MDLWQSLGMPEDDVVQAAITRIVDSTNNAGKYVSMYQRPVDDLPVALAAASARGVRIFTVPAYDLFKSSARGVLADFASSIPGGVRP
jgi:2-keto-3-deoxy-L-rhamnonate aldolase RhmA